MSGMEASTSRMNTYACNRCHQRTHSLSALFRHFCTSHGIEDNWKCGLEGCEKAFRLYSSFRKHVSRHHNHLFLQTTADTSLAPFADNLEETVQTYPTQPADQAAEQACFDVDILNTSGQCVDRGTPGSSDQCATALSSLLLKWQEGRQLPQSTLNEVANDMINFISEFRADFNATTITKLEQLRTKTGRENWWKSSHTFVSPRTVCLSDQGTSDSFEYIPILETLKAVSSVYDTFQTTHKPCSALLQDVSDGMYFKEHCLFKNASSQKLFALQLYFDEFEICNPIGSKRGKHKLLAGYLTILNLPPRFRSKVDSKHLVLLVKNSTVARFTLHKIVQPLLEDIQYLESQGVEISGEFIKGSLLYVCGDNLSSHQIGGFRECFSSGPICRFCLAKKEHISEKWNEEEFIIRTKKMHAQHIHLLKTDSSLSNVYGISGESCLSSLQSFDVTKGLPPDVMHDLFEGVISFAMKHILRHIMSCRVLTLDELNDRLVSFPLQGGDKKSRLPPLSHHSVFGTSAIKGSAAEKLCFFRFFSLLVGDLVAKGNAAYDVYLALRAIVDIVLAPQLCCSAAAQLQVLVDDFYIAFRETFPNVKIIPKMHYMIHYPRLILLYGSLCKLSCMRFEAKHQFFKSIARKTRNFKNICGTLSHRHQMQFMYSLTQPLESVTTTGSVRIDINALPDLLKDRLQELDMPTADMHSLTSVTVCERKISLGCVLPLFVPDDDLPHFAQVVLIVACDQRLFILSSIFETKYFDDHMHAFVVENTAHSVIVEDTRHVFFDPLYLYRVRDINYVNPRYAFFTSAD